MLKENVRLITYVLLLVFCVVGAILCYDNIQQRTSEKALPICNYSMTFQLQGQHHLGYWIGTSPDGSRQCIWDFTEPVTVIDKGI